MSEPLDVCADCPDFGFVFVLSTPACPNVRTHVGPRGRQRPACNRSRMSGSMHLMRPDFGVRLCTSLTSLHVSSFFGFLRRFQ